ncbi:WXG100 family type VII secretion target [Streptomyces sp. L500]
MDFADMVFADVAEPTRHLTPPQKPAEFVHPLKPVNDVGDFLSPAGWFLKLAELMVPGDPMEYAKHALAGDWESYARCADVWRNLGRSCDDLARNLGSGTGAVRATWQGNAADAAHGYFDALRKNLEDARDALYAIDDEYREIARSVAYTGEAVAACVSAILDALITVSIAVAASAASGWTGWGAAMGYALGAAEAKTILAEWAAMTNLLNAAQVAMNVSCAAIGRTGGEIAASLGAFPLPRTGYDHPAV